MNIAIYGYGNLGKGTELAAKKAGMSVFGVFTRREPETVITYGSPVFPSDDILLHKDEIDVLIICGGSATDLPEMTPELARNFNVVDSFDNHHNIPTHFENVNKSALEGGHTALISCGWDPGMFSLARAYGTAILPESTAYTFWGKGVSQGHSDAVRRIEGVLDARQYTIPVDSALARVRNGENPDFTTREKHTRECFVVAAENADREYIEKAIKTMPDYFVDYDTRVHFITQEEMKRDHSGLPHGGTVICSGKTGTDNGNNSVMEYSLKLDSNPEFTSSVLVAFARAVKRNYDRGSYGCKTVLDITPADLSPLTHDELIAKYL